MAEPLYKCWAKATDKDAGAHKYSLYWVTSRRAWFKVFDDRVECGDWVLPNSAIRDAVLFKSRQWFIPVSVLRLKTDRKTCQFGFNPWCRVEEHLPLEVRTEKVKARYSAFSLFLRLFLIVYLIYWYWTRAG